MKPTKQKKCRVCKEPFTPANPLQKVCGWDCGKSLIKAKVEKKEKKKPKAKLSTLQTKADNLASQYIRQKYADHAGNVSCVSCNKVLHWKDAHCAHFIGRSAKGTRWLEENLRPACPSCNVYRKEFHMREYTLVIIDAYGRDGLEELKAKGAEVLTGSKVRQLAEEAIDYYTKALGELKHD